MKHLVSIMAVFLLMGCQTTENTPKDIASPKLVSESPVPKTPNQGAYQTNKPVLCAPSEVVHSGLTRESKETPLIVWKDLTGAYYAALWMNKETKTVTVIEYPSGPEVACFVSTGTDAEMSKIETEKVKGIPIKGLDNIDTGWYK